MNKKSILLIIVVATGIIGLELFFYRDRILKKIYLPTATKLPPGVENAQKPDIEIIAENLTIPWDIAFLPTREMLITERIGNLLKIGTDKKIIPIEGVKHIGEGGLLGVALHPNFAKNNWLYLYLTTETSTGLSNRVERYTLNQDKLTDKTVIIKDIPGANYHDGGKIAFGPDGFLYITAGDSDRSNLAQDTNSLAGKILRVKDDGSIPSDNPFGNAVYSYGHRNPQGLAWDDQGRLFATEHGRSGILSGFDELNLIEKGANYGWPKIQGDEKKEEMKNPIIHSGPDKTWAPAAALYFRESIFFTGLRGESLYQAKISPEGKIEKLETNLREKFGRLRALALGPDGYFYISTSNTDGHGELREGDDKIIRVNPEIFYKN